MTYVLAVFAVFFLVSADQISKYYVVRELMPIGSREFINGFMKFTYVENAGAAFGFMQGGRVFFIALTCVIMVFLCFYYVKLPKSRVSGFIRVSLVFVAAGAAGNFIDRLRQGYVVDFLHFTFIDFPVFNLADVFVVAGTICLTVFLIIEARIAPAAAAE